MMKKPRIDMVRFSIIRHGNHTKKETNNSFEIAN